MLSIIVPAYNAEKTIRQCLNALVAQAYPADLYEIIVVDDGSRDRTKAIVQEYAVRYIRQENQGPAAARNKGANAARGEIILFTDSDCVPDTDWINQMLIPFEKPEIVAVKGAYKTRQKSIVARFAQIEFEERFEMLEKAESIDMVDTYSAGFRKELFLKIGGFDTSFPEANNEDTELSYRISNLGYKMAFNSQAKVYHLNHPDSIRKYARLKFWRGYWRMVVYKKFPGKMIKDTYTPQTLKLQILFLYVSLGLWLPARILPCLNLPCILSGAVFVLLTIPFTAFAVKRDSLVGLLSPFLLSLRAASLGAGIIWGMINSSSLSAENKTVVVKGKRTHG
ncbi:MAG: glycosyltransferase [Candidatus Schekmanbacteria bacterium]|nr:glycosyltransferase [Candidatus Schekmanbacteria bacterium]